MVGLGNEIASDDGAGIRVAEVLRRDLGHRLDVEVVALPWAGFALLDVLRDRRRAVLVDCLVTGKHRPGTVVRLHSDSFAGAVRLNSFHDIDLATVLRLGRALGWQMPDDVLIWAIEADDAASFGEELSPAVAAAVAAVASDVTDHLEAAA